MGVFGSRWFYEECHQSILVCVFFTKVVVQMSQSKNAIHISFCSSLRDFEFPSLLFACFRCGFRSKTVMAKEDKRCLTFGLFYRTQSVFFMAIKSVHVINAGILVWSISSAPKMQWLMLCQNGSLINNCAHIVSSCFITNEGILGGEIKWNGLFSCVSDQNNIFAIYSVDKM